MATKYPELFAALCAPFEPWEVKVLEQDGVVKKDRDGNPLMYVEANTIRNRLDDVLGFENWEMEFMPGEYSVECRLSITLPDGSKVTKTDTGGYSGMAAAAIKGAEKYNKPAPANLDEIRGNDDKGGYSDAIKRAAAALGVGRYLWRCGVPACVRDDFAAREQAFLNPNRRPAAPPPDQPAAPPAPQTSPASSTPKKKAKPEPIGEVGEWCEKFATWGSEQYAKSRMKAGKPLPDGFKLVTRNNLIAALYHQLADDGYLVIPAGPDPSAAEKLQLLQKTFFREPTLCDEYAVKIIADLGKEYTARAAVPAPERAGLPSQGRNQSTPEPKGAVHPKTTTRRRPASA